MAAQVTDDALDEIIERLYYKPDGYPDYKTLASMTLVNRQWRAAARPYLWRSVTVEDSTPATFRKFTIALTNQRLAESISSLDMTLCADRPFDLVVLACPRLYQLRVSIQVQELDEPLRDMPNVRSLVLQTWPTMSRLPFEILQHTPSLRHLRFQHELVSRAPDIPPPDDPPPFDLYELVLRRPPSDRAMEWVLSGAANLRILESWDAPNTPLRDFIDSHGARLRSLKVYTYTLPWQARLRSCVALEEFKTVRIPALQLPKLPETVEHFAFANIGRDPLGPIMHIVQRLPRLRVLTHDASTPEQDDFQALKDVCTRRGVALRLDPFAFWNNEDAIPVDRFPRTKSLSNIRYMR
ncbi:hypothetical protein AURDEDRAFT_166998 [Auricularia subglabra TFB-10046 SS5]|nr:hypothetical protein AURDEDRAFT_166998 [Auricularia subglabra TFB-10046 SS5]